MARYSKSAGKDVKRAMHRRKKGSLKSGKGGKGGTVKEPQAGHCHRPLGGAQEGQEGTQAQVQQEEIGQEEVFQAPDVQAQVPPVGLRREGWAPASQPSLARQR